jgi:hypothetical protein
MRSVEVQCPAANDLPGVLENDEIANILADLRQSARQQRAIPGICGDELVNLLRVGKKLLYACA